MAAVEGYPIVLTADRTLTAGYRLLFDGMLAASQTTTAPPVLLGKLLMPLSPRPVAPLGLRRIEAALLRDGFTAGQVVFAGETDLPRVIGPATRIIGISSGEPLGLGMNTSTMTSVAGGQIYPQALFRRLLSRIRRIQKRNGSTADLVLGGPGAWQVAGDDEARRRFGIDYVITGYAEDNVADVFRRLIARQVVDPVISGQGSGASSIPPIRGASTMGVVEISRGCGLGCRFCTIARVPMVHLPPQTILADARTNLAAGADSIAILSEDLFRYAADGLRTNPAALIELLQNLRQLPGLRLIQVDHVNVISIAQYSDDQLRAVRNLLVGNTGQQWPWVNVGIETASGSLLKASGGVGKMHGVAESDWGDFCAAQLQRLCRAGFLPMASLILGLPDETPQHVQLTLDWVRGLAHLPVTVFPVLHAPINRAPAPRSLSPLHWELIRTCYRLNFRWIPRMYWDSQRAAGVSLPRRCMMQLMGIGQIAQWKTLFAWHSWRARR